MAENTGIDTVQDDELGDEELDRTSGGKFTVGQTCRIGSS
jgi:hypothetical protein